MVSENTCFLFDLFHSTTANLECLMPRQCIIGEADSFVSILLTRFANEYGLEPVQARVGEDVCPLARQLRPAVIFLDCELPGSLRGWEAAHNLRADANLSRIPIVSCSWLSEHDARALIGDAVAYLQKPELHYDDFLAALRLADITGAGGNGKSAGQWEEGGGS
jgi:CheY-like chemotaxis protein